MADTRTPIFPHITRNIAVNMALNLKKKTKVNKVSDHFHSASCHLVVDIHCAQSYITLSLYR